MAPGTAPSTVAQRLKDDPHLQLATLLREVAGDRVLRELPDPHPTGPGALAPPALRGMLGGQGTATAEITHDPGTETQFEWLELPEAPWGGTAIVLVGALARLGLAAG